MAEYVVRFDAAKHNTISHPRELLSSGGRYRVDVLADGSIDVYGNRDGLLYLANILVQCAVAGLDPGCHVHLRLDSVDDTGPNQTCAPEPTLYAADPSHAARQST